MGVGGGDKMAINLIDLMNAAPRCHAKAKRTGFQCKAPAVNGWDVCRVHGARGGAPSGSKNGNYRHGQHTKESREEMNKIRSYARLCLESAHTLLR